MRMEALQFRFVINTERFDEVVEFYERLGFDSFGGWDRDDGRGRLLSAGGNSVVEVVAPPRGQTPAIREPAGSVLALEVRDVDEWHAAIRRSGVAPLGPPSDMPWGHRSFSVADPVGVVVIVYQDLKRT